MAICLERGADDLHMVQLMPLPPNHLCFSKIQNSLSFWYRPTQVVLEKRLLDKIMLLIYHSRIISCTSFVIDQDFGGTMGCLDNNSGHTVFQFSGCIAVL